MEMAANMTESHSASELAILFADIGGSTALYQRVGDAAAHQMIMDCLTAMRESVETAGGKLLRHVGDAVLASFTDCDSAFNAARAMHEAFRSSTLSVRVGFHWGEAIPDQGDVYGNAVNIAARVSSLANTDEIMVTQEVVSRLSAANVVRAQLLDRISVRGVQEPLEIHRLHWQQGETDQVTILYTPPLATENVRHSGGFTLSLTCSGQEVSLSADGQSVTIGRSDSNSIQTAHSAASRVHATIECKAGKFILADRSTNGTYVSKHGTPAVFVHRDSYNLDGDGVLAVGFEPNDSPESLPGLVKFSAESKR